LLHKTSERWPGKGRTISRIKSIEIRRLEVPVPSLRVGLVFSMGGCSCLVQYNDPHMLDMLHMPSESSVGSSGVEKRESLSVRIPLILLAEITYIPRESVHIYIKESRCMDTAIKSVGFASCSYSMNVRATACVSIKFACSPLYSRCRTSLDSSYGISCELSVPLGSCSVCEDRCERCMKSLSKMHLDPVDAHVRSLLAPFRDLETRPEGFFWPRRGIPHREVDPREKA
jgi:hypothetical protein